MSATTTDSTQHKLKRWTWVDLLVAIPLAVAIGIITVDFITSQVERLQSGAVALILVAHIAISAAIIFARLQNGWERVGRFVVGVLASIGAVWFSHQSLALVRGNRGPYVTGIVSNLKQMSMALVIYRTDYDDHALPPIDAWKTSLKPYLKRDLEQSEYVGWFSLNGFQYGMSPEDSELCVLLYNSTNSSPNPVGMGFDPFWIREKVLVSFGDSHVKAQTRETYKVLPWLKPNPKR